MDPLERTIPLLAPSLLPLREHFNSNAGQLQFLALLSPT